MVRNPESGPGFDEPTSEEPEEQEDKGVEPVDLSQVEELIKRTGPPKGRETKLHKIEKDDPDLGARLRDIEKRRAQELERLESPPPLELKKESRIPRSRRDVQEAARELPRLEEALEELKQWRNEWDEFSLEEQRERFDRMVVLRRGVSTWRKMDRGGGIRRLSSEERNGELDHGINLMVADVERQIEKLEAAIAGKDTPAVREARERKV